jgi:hypothetical protein
MASGFEPIRQFQMSRERANALAICTDAAANIMHFAQRTNGNEKSWIEPRIREVGLAAPAWRRG